MTKYYIMCYYVCKVKRFTPRRARAKGEAGKENREVLYSGTIAAALLFEDTAPTVNSVLTDTGTVFGQLFTWLGDVTNAIVGNPLLFIFIVGVPIVGIVTGWVLRLVRGKKRG